MPRCRGSPPGPVHANANLLFAICHLLLFRADHEIGLLYLLHSGQWTAVMRSLCLVVIAMVGCSSDPLGGHDPLSGHDPLKGQLVDQGTRDAEQASYPPGTLREQTFVLSSPVAYQSKRDGTSDDIKTASKLGGKIVRRTGAKGLIAVPINAAQGNTTIADVMVYDTARHSLVGNTVYRFSYTPPEGQTLQLDGITAEFQSGASGEE